MKRLLYLSLLILLFTGCNDDDVTLDSGARLRIQNVSDFNFDNIVVAPGGPEYDFGSLDRGETSGYVEFDGIYRYGYVRITIDGIETVLQPIDYVGETLYKRGKYTYLIDVEDPSQPFGVSLEFRED